MRWLTRGFRKWALLLVMLPLVAASDPGCYDTGAEDQARRVEESTVGRQQAQYLASQPVPFFDFSLQRDVYTQIYNATNEARQTYTVVESVMGETKWACPSIGYGIPADVNLTNPLQIADHYSGGYAILEQAEPNGLYSSKNTDGTWILCVMDNGDIAPIYTEHKVSTFPFFVTGVDAEWNPQSGVAASTTINLR